jgi:hypothetical protein
MKIHPVVADLFHADRRTDRHDEGNNKTTDSHSNNGNATAHQYQRYMYIAQC